MSMSERVSRLRKQSLDAIPSISTERAELMTAFYRQDLGPVSAPVRRALAFQHLLEHKTICINEGELIVGNTVISRQSGELSIPIRLMQQHGHRLSFPYPVSEPHRRITSPERFPVPM